MSRFSEAPNLGALHGALIIDELVRLGCGPFLIAPGSRSSPLVVAAAKHDGADVKIRVDERGAAFHALGAARGTGRPAVVITSSGTAVANLLPAVVEASMDGVPMIVLTADRPPELHDVGANQAIPQRDIFGTYPRHAVSLPPPDEGYAPLAVLHAVDEAYAAACGPRPGPVQINVELREPLAPTAAPWDPTILDPIEDWTVSEAPLRQAAADARPADTGQMVDAVRAIDTARRGLIVLGSVPSDVGRDAVALAAQLGFAVYPDLRSGMRLGETPAHVHPHLDRVLDALPPTEGPDVIVQLGGRITSKRLLQVFQRGHHAHYILADDSAPRSDATHGVTSHVHTTPRTALDELTRRFAERTPAPAHEPWAKGDTSVRALLDAAFDSPRTLSEPWVARHLSRAIDPAHALFVANSMPIRDVQDFAAGDGPAVPVAANRGASGIDGLVSSAVGYAEGLGRPTTLIVGDLALLHDLNGLGCLRYADQPLTIVVVNNGGGGIFAFLPIADHEDVFDPYFKTPHDLTFGHIANAFGLRYFEATTPAELEEGYRTAIAFGERALVEVRSDVMQNRTDHRDLDDAIRRAVGDGAS